MYMITILDSNTIYLGLRRKMTFQSKLCNVGGILIWNQPCGQIKSKQKTMTTNWKINCYVFKYSYVCEVPHSALKKTNFLKVIFLKKFNGTTCCSPRYKWERENRTNRIWKGYESDSTGISFSSPTCNDGRV